VFYSPETGEVFSDDDVSIAESLRKKLDLDAYLDNDAISNLNLSVDDSLKEDRILVSSSTYATSTNGVE
jgi:hypothetical protein